MIQKGPFLHLMKIESWLKITNFKLCEVTEIRSKYLTTLKWYGCGACKV